MVKALRELRSFYANGGIDDRIVVFAIAFVSILTLTYAVAGSIVLLLNGYWPILAWIYGTLAAVTALHFWLVKG
jgi:cytochrome c biogenesis protein CcdA